MKKYLGGAMTIYCAIIPIIAIIIFIKLSIVIFERGIDFFSIVFALWCVGFVIIWGLIMHKYTLQFYSWGIFDEKGIQIKTLFSKKCIEIEYAKCKSIGIGLYVHGVMGSGLGSKVKYIFFSYQPFNEDYRLNINLWQPSPTRIKIEFSKKLYDYLLTVLPEEQATCLKNDYEKYVKGNIEDSSVA